MSNVKMKMEYKDRAMHGAFEAKKMSKIPFDAWNGAEK